MHRVKVAAIMAACVLVSGAAHGRVFVCIESGQKVFRSEECPDPKAQIGIYSAPRARVVRRPQTVPVDAPTPVAPAALEVPQDDPRCKFSYFVLSERGKALAEDAKHECLQNLALDKAGRSEERNFTAYRLWKDYWDSARANAPRTMTCTNVGYGISTCR